MEEINTPARLPLSLLLNIWEGDDPALLKKSLDSISKQSAAPDEVVIVFDGPVGGATQQVVQEFVETARSPVVVEQLEKQTGLWAGRNHGLTRCKASWVALHDADDIMHPNRLEVLYQFAVSRAADIASTAVIEIDRSNNQIWGIRCPPIGDDDLKRRFRINNPINHPTVLFRRQAIGELGGYRNVHGAEDYDLWLRAWAASLRFEQTTDPLTLFTTGKDQIQRRGGIRFLKSELHLHRLKREIGLTGPFDGLFFLLIRIGYRLVPGKLRQLAQPRLVSRLSHPVEEISESSILELSIRELRSQFHIN